MVVILGAVLMREGGYAFDVWPPENGRSRGYVYRRVEDAHYARKAEILYRRNGHAGDLVACNTVDEYLRAMTDLVQPPNRAEGRLARQSAGVLEATARLGSRQAA